MKNKNKKILFVIIAVISLILFFDFVFASTKVYYSNVSNYSYNPYYPGFNPNPNPYYPNYNPYYPNYNPYVPYGNQNGIYGFSREGSFLIPYDSYYYMIGYDRQAYVYANGEVMQSRVPILSGNYQYPTQIANRLIYSAYVSISNWCNDNIMSKENVQDYYLNNASVESVSPTQVVLIVDCALKKKGIISGYEQFRLTINIQSSRFVWRNIGTNGHWLYGDGRIYEYDSNRGNIIIIN